jgi:uncharacterized protein YfaS (alpha-2-macroglobulin family)
MKTKALPRFLIFMLIAAIASCSSPRKDTDPTPIDSYYGLVAGVTSGVVKRSDPVIVKFAGDVVGADQVGKSINRSTFKIKPSVSGEAKWTSTDAIEFIPSKLLDWDTEYTATLKLGSLTDVPDELSLFVFRFRTPKKQFSVTHSGLSMDAENNNKYLIRGKLTTSDEFSPEEVEGLLSATVNNKKFDVEWEHNPKSNLHLFTLGNIERAEAEGRVEIAWDGSKSGVEKHKGGLKIVVPSISDFKVTSAKVINIPDQYVEILFSDPIQQQTDFRGLINIEDQAVQRVQVNRNEMRIYLPARITGMHEVELNASIESVTGYKLDKTVSYSLNFGGLKPRVRLLGEGVIVPQNQGLHFPFEAVNLSAVDVRITKIFANNIHAFLQENNYENSYRINRVGRIIHSSKVELAKKGASDLSNWNAFNLDLAELIEVENGAIYNVEIGFRKSYSLFHCNASDDAAPSRFIPIEDELQNPGMAYESVYFSYYYNWQQNDNACSYSYYSPYRFVKRNIMGSDMGIIAKTDAAGTTYVYVTNLVTAMPEPGVNVEFYDYQNQHLNTATTNSEGMLSVKTEREPFLIITKKGNSVGYLKIDPSTGLSTANFDVGGRDVQKGIKGFLYGERDVWRPGDSIFVSFILEDKQQNLPQGHPLVFEVYNPAGQMMQRMVKNRDNKFIYPCFFTTAPDAPTGNWQVILKAGAVQFSRVVRVETVKPNRLKVELDFDDEMLSAQRKTPVNLQSAWLHGTPARNLKARVDVSFSSYAPSFSAFPNFDFSTPYNKFYGQDITLFYGSLNNDGRANFNFEFQPNNEVSGFLRASFTTKVFEPGGDFSINNFSAPFSPYPNYVGLNIDWSYKSWNKLDNDKDHIIEVATVNEKGGPVNVKGLDVKIYQLEYRWWYHSNNENLASYSGQTYHKPVLTTNINTENGKGSFSIGKDEDRWGRHLILITSPDGHTAGQVVYFGWPWGKEKQRGGAQVLALVAEKDKFKTGENVSIGFPANTGARALITFENGTGIIGQEWIENLTDYNHYAFEAKPEMTPNVYVHITLLQPHGQTVNDLPIRLYGVVPIMVEDEKTRLQPKIELPDEVRPLNEFTIRVSEENKQAMDYTLAIVDEGLLDLTNFKTPDPWASFYAREALGVKTFDMYNYVMGAFGSRLESMFAVGGSDAVSDNSKKKAERFKPVIQVLGPFRLDARSKDKHEIILPQYVGSVRVMVVAADNGKYGHADQSLPVREPLMVLATMPRVLSPGETVEVPVSVFAMHRRVKDVKLTLETNQFLSIEGENEMDITFNEMGEQDVYFRVKSNEKTGVATLKITAVSGRESSFHDIELDIRQANPPTVHNNFSMLKPGEKWESTVEAIGMEGTNNARLELSSMPPLNLGRRLNYLIRYPHGCIEQITSAAFPQLYLPVLLELDQKEKDKVKRNIEACISNLPRYQLTNGGFAYWPGGTSAEAWSSCYAGYFLLEAENAGYLVPGNVKTQWLNYMRSEAIRFSPGNSHQYENYTQAYRLYLLAIAGEAQITGMNRLRTFAPELDVQTKWMLAGAYAFAGMKEAALDLVDFRNMEPDKPYPQVYGSYLRDQAVILQVLLALGENEHAYHKATEISKQLASPAWMSTQTTAYALLSLADFVRKTATGEMLDYAVDINGNADKKQTNSTLEVVDFNFDTQGKADVKVTNHGQGSLFVNLINTGVKAGLDTGSEARGLEMKVQYSTRNGQQVNPGAITRGNDFIARVTVRNKTGSAIDNLALSQMVPAGWEIMNTRLFETGSSLAKNDPFDYQDIRDDRVYTYFSLSAYQEKTFSIQLTAAYTGLYLMPALTCEAMYNNMYFAKVPGMRVEVVKE